MNISLQELLALKEFEDSVQAEAYMILLGKLLEHPALLSWAKDTDENFAAGTLAVLEATNQIFDDFYNLMVEVGE